MISKFDVNTDLLFHKIKKEKETNENTDPAQTDCLHLQWVCVIYF